MTFRLILCAFMALFFTPLGVFVVYASFGVEDAPHVFVMLIFSGSLMILLGLAGIGGLVMREKGDPKGKAE